MADSFYANGQVEVNQKPMGVGLLSLFALENIVSVSINSPGKCAIIETNLLWESENYWSSWTDLITETPEIINGFELKINSRFPRLARSNCICRKTLSAK
jgi:hypothetical protein